MNIKKAIRLRFFAAALLTGCILCACAAKEEIPEATAPETVPDTTAVTEQKPIEITDDLKKKESIPEKKAPEREIIDGQIRSFLTGEMVPAEIGTRRPLAVMISNDKEAAPHYGINRAGVIYEAPVEGAMNRFMAVIEDYDDLERIGSVRSCRTYYTYFAREWDAVYAHFGQSTFALPYLDNVDNINGLKQDGAFYRSSDKKSPHNAYTSGERIRKYIDKLGYRDTYDKDYLAGNGHFQFASASEPVNFEEELSWEAYKVLPGYPYNKPWFEYNEEDGLYYRYQYGKEHMGNEAQLAVKNIIFQYCPTGHYATTEYLNIGLHGDSYGYYFTNGRVRPVASKKDGEFDVTRYYDMDGNEIVLNPGKTWICIIRADAFDKTEIYGKDGKLTNK